MPDIVGYIGRIIGWFRGVRQLLQKEKRIAAEDVGVALENIKKLCEEQLARERNREKKKTIHDKLNETNEALRGYYMAKLRSALERSGIGPYDALVANGKSLLEPENKAKLSEAVTRLDLLPPAPTAEEFVSSAVAKHALERYEDALTDLDHALQLRPNNPVALNNRGVIYQKLGRSEEALADFSHALQPRPDDHVILTNRGVIHAILERNEEALADLNQALKLRPDCLEALIARGISYNKLERYEEALADLNQALKLRPDRLEALIARGDSYDQLERHEEALADLNQALKIKPDDPLALFFRGIYHSKRKHYDEALADFNSVLQQRPNDATTFYNLACLFSLMRRTEEAIGHLETAIGLDEKNRRKAVTDSDFDNIRDDPRFRRLIERS